MGGAVNILEGADEEDGGAADVVEGALCVLLFTSITGAFSHMMSGVAT